MALPKTTQDRIKADANKKYPLIASHTHSHGPRSGYIAGATAEAERAQKLVEALGKAKHALENSYDITDYPADGNTIQDAAIKEIEQVLAEWKGAGKEVDRPCPHCGKELSRDRNLCCRECGKEVSNGA